MEVHSKLKSLFEGDFFEDRGVLIGSEISTQVGQSHTNAERYSGDEFVELMRKAGLTVRNFHTEEACHSGHFTKMYF